jgi:hypothetical protein
VEEEEEKGMIMLMKNKQQKHLIMFKSLAGARVTESAQ